MRASMMQSVSLSLKCRMRRSSRVEFTPHCTYVWYSVRCLLSPFPLLSRNGFMCGSSRTLESWNQVQASQFKESRLSSWREWIRPPTLQPRVWVVENFSCNHRNVMGYSKYSTRIDHEIHLWTQLPIRQCHIHCSVSLPTMSFFLLQII